MTPKTGQTARVDVLLVEDGPGHVRLTQEAFGVVNPDIFLHIALDGVEAMEFLNRRGAHADAPRPDFILLDLNLPGMDGREVLARVKGDKALRSIPTIILTTSDAEADVLRSYELQANCYLTKPVQYDDFEGVVKLINEFWLNTARLPNMTRG